MNACRIYIQSCHVCRSALCKIQKQIVIVVVVVIIITLGRSRKGHSLIP